MVGWVNLIEAIANVHYQVFIVGSLVASNADKLTTKWTNNHPKSRFAKFRSYLMWESDFTN